MSICVILYLYMKLYTDEVSMSLAAPRIYLDAKHNQVNFASAERRLIVLN